MNSLRLEEDRFLFGQVVKGKQLGRTIGFPTANLEVDVGTYLENGVYGVYVFIQGKRYFGVMNIGERPTFNDGEHNTYEVYILDFNENIYQEILTIEIKFYIRPEQKFNQLQDLIQQLRADVFHARKQFHLINKYWRLE